MKIAVIPARGGSKRILKKNIKDFCGKPIITWSIISAQQSNLFDHIIISTDDSEIAKVAHDWQAEVPFMRPAALADDYTGTAAVIAHAIKWALAQNWQLTAVCCIYATAPFIQIPDLITGLSALESGKWQYAFPVTDFAAPIFRSFQLHPQGGLEMFFPEQFMQRSQDLPQAFHDAGQFYWGLPEAWLHQPRVYERYSFPILIPRWRVQDIDTEADWHRAELIYRALLASQ